MLSSLLLSSSCERRFAAMISHFLILLSILHDVVSEGTDDCRNYNGTIVQFGESYLKTVCEECDCLGADENGEDIGPCFEMGYQCPCDTLCCRANCSDDVLEPNDAFKNTALNSNYSIIISVGVATLIIVLGLLFYLYRRRVTSYVRVTRRLYMERQMSAPKPPSPELPPNYEDIAADGGPAHRTMPPPYEELVPPYSLLALQRHDQIDNVTLGHPVPMQLSGIA